MNIYSNLSFSWSLNKIIKENKTHVPFCSAQSSVSESSFNANLGEDNMWHVHFKATVQPSINTSAGATRVTGSRSDERVYTQ